MTIVKYLWPRQLFPLHQFHWFRMNETGEIVDNYHKTIIPQYRIFYCNIKPNYMKRLIISLLALCMLTYSCKKEKKEDRTFSIQGYAQKGPFVAGANVTIIELDSNLDPTGRIFETVVEDNSGKFSFPNVEFATEYVEIKVVGQAYDEIYGFVPNETLTLTSVAEVSTSANINVNIITNLISPRIKGLVNAGLSFDDAKKQSEMELLKIFNLEKHSFSGSELMNLADNNIDGGALLLISSLIQFRCLTEMNYQEYLSFQEYVTKLQIDFSDNGSIDTEIYKKSLYTSAQVLDMEQVNKNLTSRYSEMGIDYMAYNCDALLNEFIRNSTFPSYFDNVIPAERNNMINLLAQQDDTIYIDSNAKYLIALDCPQDNSFGSAEIFVATTDNTFVLSDKFITDTPYPNLRLYYSNYRVNGGFQEVLDAPISFSKSGQLTITAYLKSIRGIDFKIEKTVIWN